MGGGNSPPICVWSKVMQDNILGSILIKAKKTSPCSCGMFVHAGDYISWDPIKKETVGCSKCNHSGDNPAPGDWELGFSWLDEGDYLLFHE